MRKIKNRIFMAFLVFTIILQSSMFVNATTNATTTDDESVKAVINTYFTNEFESIKNSKAVENDDIIKNIALKEYTSVNNRFWAQWYEKVGVKLTYYKLYIDYQSIQFNNGICTVLLEQGADKIFDKSPDITQETRNKEYTIILKRYDSSWCIEDILLFLKLLSLTHKLILSGCALRTLPLAGCPNALFQ